MWRRLLFYCLIGGLLLVGGTGKYVFEVSFASFFLLALALAGYLIVEKEIELPQGFWWYVAFLVIQVVSLFWTLDVRLSYEYLVMYISGGMFWVLAYNWSELIEGWLGDLVLSLGMVFGGLFGWVKLKNIRVIRGWSLYFYNSKFFNNNHIGNWWAVVVVILLIWWMRKKKWWQVVLGVVGMGIIIMSQSRAALVAIVGGLWYLYEKRKIKTRKWMEWSAGVLLLAGFVFIGFDKSTLLSRQYFVQALAGLWHNPLGVGVGNFRHISGDSAMHWLGLSDFAIVVFNVVLEMMVSLGWLGLVFVWWLVKRVEEVWKMEGERGLVERTVFLVLTVNFMFAATYFQPSMFWLWMLSLGVSQGVIELRGGE